MKVGFEAKRAFANRTGLGNYSRQMIIGLLEYKKNLQLSLFTTSDNINNWLPKNRTNIHVILYQGFLKSFWRMFGQVKDQHFKELDIYHGLSHEIPWGGRIENPKLKWVVTIHDLIFIRYPHLYSLPDRLIYKWKFKHACHKADKIVAISKQTADDLIEFWQIPKDKIKVIYQSCDDSFRHSWSEEQITKLKQKYKLPSKFILYLGTLEERKNALRLVQAFHQAGSLDSSLVLVGGGGEYRKKIENYIKVNNLEKSVLLLGRVPFEDLPGLYQACLFFAYPSLFEGFGIPIIEALFSGKAVLTSQGSCFSEAAGNAGLYVDPLSVEDIAKGITQLVSNVELRDGLAENGKSYVKNFLPAKIADDLYNLYRGLMK